VSYLCMLSMMQLTYLVASSSCFFLQSSCPVCISSTPGTCTLVVLVEPNVKCTMYILQPMAYGTWPMAYGLVPTSYGIRPTAYGLWPMAYGIWPTAYGLRHIYGIWPTAHVIQHTAYNPTVRSSLVINQYQSLEVGPYSVSVMYRIFLYSSCT